MTHSIQTRLSDDRSSLTAPGIVTVHERMHRQLAPEVGTDPAVHGGEGEAGDAHRIFGNREAVVLLDPALLFEGGRFEVDPDRLELGKLLERFDLTQESTFYWFSLLLLGLVIVTVRSLRKSRIGRVLIARGRDATDVPISNVFGVNSLAGFRVWTDEA